jgi:hypothetical protein
MNAKWLNFDWNFIHWDEVVAFQVVFNVVYTELSAKEGVSSPLQNHFSSVIVRSCEL